MTPKIAFLFPGQGSQAPGMGKALADAFPAARAIFDEPGTYVLRARADDGALTTDEDVTVVVSR